MLFSGDVVAVTALLSYIAGALSAVCVTYWITAYTGKHSAGKQDKE